MAPCGAFPCEATPLSGYGRLVKRARGGYRRTVCLQIDRYVRGGKRAQFAKGFQPAREVDIFVRPWNRKEHYLLSIGENQHERRVVRDCIGHRSPKLGQIAWNHDSAIWPSVRCGEHLYLHCAKRLFRASS